jgi:hypothetical protein
MSIFVTVKSKKFLRSAGSRAILSDERFAQMLGEIEAARIHFSSLASVPRPSAISALHPSTISSGVCFRGRLLYSSTDILFSSVEEAGCGQTGTAWIEKN